MPGSWGLKGKTRQLAEAEYYFEGKELELQLVDINQPDLLQAELDKLDILLKYGDVTSAQYQTQTCMVKMRMVDRDVAGDLAQALAKIELQLEYGEITPVDYLTEKCAIKVSIAERDIVDPIEQGLTKLAIQLEHGAISEVQYNRQAADVKKEPYVNVVDIGVDPEGAITGYLELDWNDEFVAMLQNNGYVGASDDAIVNKWFNNVCRTILIQEQADLDYGMESESAATIRTISKD